MKHEEFSWKQADKKIYGQAWRAEKPKAALCIVHGFGEHSGRYEEAAKFFVANGFSVYAIDQFGHGKTEGKRGFSPSYEETLESVQGLIRYAREQTKDVPVFVWGHSMGGNVVLNYLLRRKPKVAGAIAGSPWLRLAFEPPKFKIALAKLMRNIYPAFAENTNLDATTISRDPEQVKKYQTDPLVHGQTTAGTFFETYEAGNYALEHASEIQVPLLLIHGSGDKLIDPKGSADFYVKAPKNIVNYKEYSGFYHELINEPEPDRTIVLNDMLSWLNAQIK